MEKNRVRSTGGTAKRGGTGAEGAGSGLDRLMVCDPPVSPEVQTAIHSTELRLIVQIHSTFSRKRH
ncbi:MAG: hypothetical protein MR873_07675, partial [Parabacteroides sp.]|nr:hypothetical protein [Parabacteroides sp.]MDY6005541.1 hypothetical protein [Parabacteroides sp.]